MRHILRFFICVSLFFLLSGPVCAEWFELDKDEKYVTDFTLKRDQTKTVTINSKKKIWVGFKSDATPGQSQKYGSSNPIRLEQKETRSWLASLFEASTMFEPVNGKINLAVKNESPDNFKIVIFKK